jgi:hypothetical protein
MTIKLSSSSGELLFKPASLRFGPSFSGRVDEAPLCIRSTYTTPISIQVSSANIGRVVSTEMPVLTPGAMFRTIHRPSHRRILASTGGWTQGPLRPWVAPALVWPFSTPPGTCRCTKQHLPPHTNNRLVYRPRVLQEESPQLERSRQQSWRAGARHALDPNEQPGQPADYRHGLRDPGELVEP